MIKLTFDTNVLRDYLEARRMDHSHAVALVRLDAKGICEIRVVSRFTADVPNGDLRRRLDELSICKRPRIGTIAQWNMSEWDADFWVPKRKRKPTRNSLSLFFLPLITIACNTEIALPMSAISSDTCAHKETYSSRGTGTSCGERKNFVIISKSVS
jgi:hypothetical protein